MKLELKIYSCLCGTKIFEINGIIADSNDFGYQEDLAPDNAEPYGCGDMQLIPKSAHTEILNKYHISANEYEQICAALKEKLSFGECGWCV